MESLPKSKRPRDPSTPSEEENIKYEELSLALLNIDRLRKKTHEVKHIIAHHKLHVVALCETKLDASVAESDVSISGFRMWRKDRDSYGGGVALYVQDHIETRLRSDLMKADVEIIWVEIKLPEGRPVLLGCCYRPSSTNAKYLKKIHDTMTQVSKEKDKDIFLMGDFNIDWNSDEKKKTADLISNLVWNQIVEVPTRVAIDSNTCIDHIYTNTVKTLKSLKTESIPTGCSDHNLITVKISRNVPQSEGNFRSNQFDREEFQRDIQGGKWGEVCRLTNLRGNSSNGLLNLKTALEEFTKIFLQVADKHSPLKSQDIYCLLKLNTELESLICERDKVKSDMINKILPLIEEKKELQGQINNYLNGKTKRSSCKDNNNTSEEAAAPKAEDPQETSTENTDSGSVSENSQIKQRKRRRSGRTAVYKEVDHYTVTKWLEYICDHVICEIDKTEAELLKLAAKNISAPIRDILNGCINIGEFPEELKKIKLFPFSANNYIHIRRSSGADRLHIILSYVFDVILYEQAKPFFIRDEKTLTATLHQKLKQPETDRLSPGEANRAEALLLDFTSSFDTISYKQLITNLGTSDFSDSALTLIKSFLSIHEGSHGLPRGSCLAQLLRIIIINDLKKNLESSAVICNSYMMIYGNKSKLDKLIETVNNWNKHSNISFEIRRKEFKPFELSKILESMLRCHGDESNWIRAPGNIVKQNGDWEYDNVSKELELHFGPEYKVEPK